MARRGRPPKRQTGAEGREEYATTLERMYELCESFGLTFRDEMHELAKAWIADAKLTPEKYKAKAKGLR